MIEAKKTRRGRVKRISTELSVGLTCEAGQLLKFASEALETPPSNIARRYISEGLVREGWPQRAAQFMTGAKA
jgi:hypothetical protein